MLDLQNYDGIIFDMDGTLIDSMGGHLEAWRKTCERYGYPFDFDYMNSLGGVPTKKTVEILNQKFMLEHDPVEVAKTKREMWEAMDYTPSLIAETFAVFEHYLPLKKVGIGTGAERPHAEHLLDFHGIKHKLHALVTASDVKNGKPHPETYLKVAEIIGVAPQKCIVFEDTEIGIQAAHEAGMDYKLVRNGIIQD